MTAASMRTPNGQSLEVLYLLNSSQIGGGNRSMLTLWSFIRAHGVGVHAIAPADGPMVEACHEAGVEVSVVPNDQPSWREPLHLIQSFGRWTSAIRTIKPALVHSNGFAPWRSIALAAYVRRLPHICHVRFGESPAYLRWVFRGLPKPDVFIFASRALLDEMREELDRACPHARYEVVHNGVDLRQFVPAPRAPGPARVGIVANLLGVKGHEDFLHMASLLVSRRVDAHFWIIGGDIFSTGYEAELQQLARDLNVSGVTTFFGHRNDVPALTAQLDVLVGASHEEPFGRTLIEAMACSKPVVATRVGGIPEIVVDGVTGLLVPPGSPDALAAAVSSVLESPELAARLGSAGRLRVEQEFSGASHARRVRSIYAELLQ
jgi:glycosyltransferase involved in cell wall biosynthesis